MTPPDPLADFSPTVRAGAKALYVAENFGLIRASWAWDNICSDLLKQMYARRFRDSLSQSLNIGEMQQTMAKAHLAWWDDTSSGKDELLMYIAKAIHKTLLGEKP